MTTPFREIRVFISSRCVGDYVPIRRELYDLLMSSVVFEPSMFEEFGAKSCTPEEAYIRELADCDVCVFIIRNGDGLTEGVLQEIDCAIQRKIKSFFYLCGFENYPEELERRLPRSSMPVIRRSLANLQDIPRAAFTDLQRDVLDVYRGYCNNVYVADLRSENEAGPFSLSGESSLSLPKSTVKAIDATTEVFMEFVFDDSNERNNASNEFDRSCANLARRMLFDGSVDSFNWKRLITSLNESIDNSAGIDVIESRWEAIIAYYKQDYGNALNHQAKAYQLAQDCSMPDWLIKDILIDLRNIDSIEKLFSSEYQGLLDESDTALSYPMLDRENADFYSDLNEQQEKELERSIYTITFGNSFSSPIGHLCRAFVIAAAFGSLTHLLQTRKKLEALAITLCNQYGCDEFGMLLLKVLLLSGDGAKIERMVQAMGAIDSPKTSSDAYRMFESVWNCAPPTCKQAARFEAFHRLGTSMEGSDYSKAEVQFMTVAQSFCVKRANDVKPAKSMMRAIRANSHRLNSEWSFEQCLRMLQSRRLEVAKEALVALRSAAFDFNHVGRKVLSNILSATCVVTKANSDFLGFDAAVVFAMISRERLDLREECAECANDCLNDYSKRIFHTEIDAEDDNALEENIVRYIKKIEDDNATQGQNGVWSHSALAEYQNTANLIELIEEPSRDLICRAAEAALGTLNANGRMLGDKLDAYDLIMRLLALPSVSSLEDIGISEADLLNVNLDAVSASMIGENESLLNLSISHEALLCAAGLSNVSKLEDLLIDTYSARDFDKAKSANTLRYMLSATSADCVSNKLSSFLYAYASALYASTSFQVRIVAIELLFEMLLIAEVSHDVARQLVNSFEIKSPNEKCRILRHQKEIQDANEAAWEDLKQRSLNDLDSISRSVAEEQFAGD